MKRSQALQFLFVLSGLVVLLVTGIARANVILPKATPVAAPAPESPGYLSPPAAYPGHYMAADNQGDADPVAYHLTGSLRTFGWAELNPANGVYNWGLLDGWLSTVASLGKKAAIGITTYNGRCCGGINAMPTWARNANTTFNVCNYSDCGGVPWYIPQYWSAEYKSLYGTFIHALGARYRNDPRIEWVAIGIGTFGELHATDGDAPWYPHQDRTALLNILGGDDDVASAIWLQTAKEITDIYMDAFSEDGQLRKTLLVQVGSYTFKATERRDLADYAASLGIGLSNNDLYPDGNVRIMGPDSNCPGCGKNDHILAHNHEVPIAFETYEYMLCTPTYAYWAMLNAADKRADYLRLSVDLFYDEEGNDRTENLAIFEYIRPYIGATVDNTPSVWVAMREHRNPWIACRGREDASWYPQLGNYDFYMEQDDSVPGGHTVPETNDSQVTGLGWCPNPPAGSYCYEYPYNPDLPPGREGWVARRTDQATGNPYIWFKVDDGYLYGPSNAVTITVTYADVGSDRWALRYQCAGGECTAAPQGSSDPWVQKTDSRTWKQAVFVLTDANLSNGLAGGSDFRLDCLGDGDEHIHFVDLTRTGGSGVPTPTPSTLTPTWTPTHTPTPVGTPPTPTPTPTVTPTPVPPMPGQWTVRWRTGGALRDIAIHDATLVWAVGDAGGIWRTTDGGITWGYRRSTPAVNLRAITFVDDLHGWIAGEDGVLLHSEDGGQTWGQQTTGTDLDLFDVAFVDTNIGWAVGQDGLILHTTDGGNHWDGQSLGITDDFHALHALDASHAWVVGQNGRVYHTNDGLNWEPRSIGSTTWLWDVYFQDENNGWVTGIGGTVLHTTDGGDNWTSQYTGIAWDLFALDFADATTGWAVGDNGRLLRTTNGGNYWVEQTSNTAKALLGVDALDTGTVWVVGAGHTILRTANSGVEWQTVGGGTPELMRAVHTPDGVHIWAVGDDGYMIRSTDGGTTWRYLDSGAVGFLNDVQFVDANTGWAVGRYGLIMKTTDGGASWRAQDSGYSGWIFTIQMWDALRGWIGGNGGRIWRTENGGSTWSQYNASFNLPVNDLDFSDLNHGWAVSEADTLGRTSDGGVSWQRSVTGSYTDLYGVDFADNAMGWVVGDHGTIMHSTDGGITWARQNSKTSLLLHGLHMLNEKEGFAVGYGGTIRWTVDGVNWWPQQSGVSDDLLDVHMLSVNEGWAVGANGVVLSYHGDYVPPTPTPTPTNTPTPTFTPTPTPTFTPSPTPSPQPGTGHIAGIVFYDANGNKNHDDGEPPLAGAQIELQQGGSTLDSITTGMDGRYAFRDLSPGDYDVLETDPAGYTSDPADNIRSVTVVSGTTVLADFPDQAILTPTPTRTPTATATPTPTVTATPVNSGVRGTVYHDLNGDGFRDQDEPGIAGAVVALQTMAGSELQSVTTGGDGAYAFLELKPAQYRVAETDPPGYVSTTDNRVTFYASPGAVLTINFGDRAEPTPTPTATPTSTATPTATPSVGQLSGVVYEDLDRNGVRDEREPPIAGVEIILRDAQGNKVGVEIT
ncbi:MAG TPA: hypothetical protein EYH31_04710, partial [Anaerolineae bacterium]|nr:hypothetical protein [Anaerolineae bacterium]